MAQTEEAMPRSPGHTLPAEAPSVCGHQLWSARLPPGPPLIRPGSTPPRARKAGRRREGARARRPPAASPSVWNWQVPPWGDPFPHGVRVAYMQMSTDPVLRFQQKVKGGGSLEGRSQVRAQRLVGWAEVWLSSPLLSFAPCPSSAHGRDLHTPTLGLGPRYYEGPAP